MDALSQTLRVVHLAGAIFINARLTAPWCYQSPSVGPGTSGSMLADRADHAAGAPALASFSNC
jgi:hypothetical protein